MAKLEICAGSVESACNAQNGGADRVELCTDLVVGGLTPGKEMILRTRELLHIPLYVLIRPRSGNFHYTPMELELMRADIAFCAEAGCDGVVIGTLTAERHIDETQTSLLMQEAGFMDVTFHKAFDEVADYFEALDTLKELDIQRILTSGGAATAVEGMELLDELVGEAGDDLVIMPGGSIRPENIQKLKALGAQEYHSSALTHNTTHADLASIKSMKRELAKGTSNYCVSA